MVVDLTKHGIAVEEARGDLNNHGKLAKDSIVVSAGQGVFVEQLRELKEFQGIQKLATSTTRKDYFLIFSNNYYATSGDTVNKLCKLIPAFKKTPWRRPFACPSGSQFHGWN